MGYRVTGAGGIKLLPRPVNQLAVAIGAARDAATKGYSAFIRDLSATPQLVVEVRRREGWEVTGGSGFAAEAFTAQVRNILNQLEGATHDASQGGGDAPD